MNIENNFNLKMSAEKTPVYANVDGLSLQNLYFTEFNHFPSCYMFTNDNRDGDCHFDTPALAKYLINKYKDEKGEHVEYLTYTQHNLSTKEDNVGFCICLYDRMLFARIENSISESYILHTDGNQYMDELLNDFNLFYEKVEPEKNNYYLLSFNQGFSLVKIKVDNVDDYDVDEQFNDDFKAEDEKINRFISKDKESGIVILHGMKGTGKTTYIRHLINTYPDRKFVSVPASIVNLLGEPQFASFLTGLYNHVFILEDCENAIVDRKMQRNSNTVSILLNLSDGLLSDSLGIKFICTFNDDMNNIDPALLRKGRLKSKYEFKKLCTEKCNRILNRVYPDKGYSVNTPLTLADVFNYEDDSYDNERIKIGF